MIKNVYSDERFFENILKYSLYIDWNESFCFVLAIHG